MDANDFHLCLSCNQTILGLDNYVEHKRSHCQVKKNASLSKAGPYGLSKSSVCDLPSSNNNLHIAAANPAYNECVSSHFLSAMPPVHNPNFVFSIANHSNVNTVFSDPTDQYITSLNKSSDIPMQLHGISSVGHSSNSSRNESYSNRQSFDNQTIGNKNPFTVLNGNIPCMQGDNMGNKSNMTTMHPMMDLQHVANTVSLNLHQNSTGLDSNPAVVSSSNNELRLDVQSQLSNFLSSNLSPVTREVNSHTTISQDNVVGNCEDFFQSLELQSKPKQDTKRENRSPMDEDDIDLDLPLSRILSTLDFGNAGDLVDFRNFDDVEDDGSFEANGNDEDYMSWNPPSSHTAGKWKPGESPKRSSCTGRWRKGSSASQQTHHGGKWKPGMSRGKSIQDKVYECRTCSKSFKNRFLYSNHCGLKSHKNKMSKMYNCLACDVTMTSSQAYTRHCKLPSHKSKMRLQELGNTLDGSPKNQELSNKDDSVLNTPLPTVNDKHCLYCKSSFKDSVELAQHASTCTEQLTSSLISSSETESVFSCSTCGMSFNNRFAYSRHHQGLCKGAKPRNQEQSSNPENMSCLSKDESATTENITAESEPQSVEVCSNNDTKHLRLGIYSCSACKQSFTSQERLQTHCSICSIQLKCDGVKQEKNQHCCICDVTYKDDEEQSEHLISTLHAKFVEKSQQNRADVADKENDVDGESQTKHECVVCGKVFSRHYDLIRHLISRFHRNRAMDHPQKMYMLHKYHRLLLRISPFQCNICQFFFNREDDFVLHLDSHLHHENCSSIVGEILCVSCKYSSSEPGDIVTHLASDEHRDVHEKSKSLCIVKEKRRDIKCQYCGIVMNSRTRLKKHIECRHKDKIASQPFHRSKRGVRNEPLCPTCGKQFLSPSALAIHINCVHKNKKLYSCTLCNKMLKSKTALDRHVTSSVHMCLWKKKTAEQKLQASKISKAAIPDVPYAKTNSDDNNDVEMPLQVEKRETDFEEYEPPVSNEDASWNYLYYGKKTKAENFKCHHCGTKFCSFDTMRTHVEEDHPRDVYHCEYCGYQFLSQTAYRIHCSSKYHQRRLRENKSPDEKLFKCVECGMQFAEENWRNFHTEYKHNHVHSEGSLAKVLKGTDIVSQQYGSYLDELNYLPNTAQVACPICKRLMKKLFLRDHIRQHTGERPFKCNLCEKRFSAHLSLRRHLMTHFNLIEKSCEICGKNFNRMHLYKSHLQQHRNTEKGQVYMCEICGMVFPLEKQVTVHMTRHGERKFKCPYEGCSWKFFIKSELQVHVYSHTGEKKYLCDTCGNGYATRTRLLRHVRTHTQERNYHCKHCNYRAGSASHLHRHMRIHLGSKPYKCPYCAYTCNTHENVRKHITKTRKHKGLSIYPCKLCSFGCNHGKEFRNHLLLNHPDEVKGSNLDALSVFTGLYDRDKDLSNVSDEAIKIIAKPNAKANKKAPGTLLIDCPAPKIVVPLKRMKVDKQVAPDYAWSSNQILQQVVEGAYVNNGSVIFDSYNNQSDVSSCPVTEAQHLIESCLDVSSRIENHTFNSSHTFVE